MGSDPARARSGKAVSVGSSLLPDGMLSGWVRSATRCFAAVALLNLCSCGVGASCSTAPQIAPAIDAVALQGVELEMALDNVPIHGTAGQVVIMDPDHGKGGKVDLQVSMSQPLTVKAEGAKWDLAKGLVVFHGNVLATRAQVSLSCDTLEVSYTNPQRLERAVATGNVIVKNSQRVASGGKAVLDVDSGRLTLSGHPQVVEGPQRLTGRLITFFLDDERLECELCTLVVEGAAIDANARLPQSVPDTPEGSPAQLSAPQPGSEGEH